jgi:hypothetical protein
MARHVSAEKLARFRAGDLPRAAARRAAAHLSGCARCRAQSDALAGLPALLAGTRVPPIPAHLAARIETALATESAHRAAEADAPARARTRRDRAAAQGVARGRATGDRAGIRLPWAGLPGPARRGLATAAVLAVIGGGGYAVVSAVGGPQGTASSAAPSGLAPARSAPSAVPSAAVSALPRSSNGLVQRHPAAGTVPGAVGPVLFGPLTRYSYSGSAGSFTPVVTGTNYLPADLAAQAAQILATVRATQARPPGPVSAFPGGTLARLPGCVGRIAAGATVLLVDQAQYQGTPATIIITGPVSAGGPMQVWAAGSSCSSSGSDVLARQALP